MGEKIEICQLIYKKTNFMYVSIYLMNDTILPSFDLPRTVRNNCQN